jgi:hypothetical protein
MQRIARYMAQSPAMWTLFWLWRRYAKIWLSYIFPISSRQIERQYFEMGHTCIHNSLFIIILGYVNILVETTLLNSLRNSQSNFLYGTWTLLTFIFLWPDWVHTKCYKVRKEYGSFWRSSRVVGSGPWQAISLPLNHQNMSVSIARPVCPVRMRLMQL